MSNLLNPVNFGLKRIFDLIIALIGFGVLLPILPIIAFLVKVTSPGPVFFIQERIGRFGRSFRCYKFRTMSVGASKFGSITSSNDSRITPLGRFLRKFKIDEIPQVLNIIIGKMSFVGPRPDVPGYADKLTGDNAKILRIHPGITGPATLYFRYEEEILSQVNDKKIYNDTIIWPKKIELNKRYIENWSLLQDIGYIIITIFPFVNKLLKLVPNSPKNWTEVESEIH